MNLKDLFKEQQLLRDKIAYNEPDRFEKLILALLVELGECANEWRGFKFWSKDQEPQGYGKCTVCEGKGMHLSIAEGYGDCKNCNGTGIGSDNPLLEEYVDGLHFVLELCIELELEAKQLEMFIGDRKKIIGSITNHFGYIYHHVSELMDTGSIQDKAYKMLHVSNAYLGLGYRLGFTWDQIEQAYMEKNAINHQRQEDGY